MRNGMQAHVVSDGSGYRLVVQGHDSPLLTYAITERQMLALTDWGTNTANKKAYNVFTSIVGNDFCPCPKCQRTRGHGTAWLQDRHWRIRTDCMAAYAASVSGLDSTQPVGLSSAQSGRRPVLSGRTGCAGTMGRTNETRRTAIRRLRLLLQGKQAGSTPARTGCAA